MLPIRAPSLSSVSIWFQIQKKGVSLKPQHMLGSFNPYSAARIRDYYHLYSIEEEIKPSGVKDF